MCRSINQVLFLPDQSVCSRHEKIKRRHYNPSKNTAKFCNFKLELVIYRNISKYSSHNFPGAIFTGHERLITRISGRHSAMPTLIPTIKFYKQHFFCRPHLVFSFTIYLQTLKSSFSAEANSQYIRHFFLNFFRIFDKIDFGTN